MKDYYKKTANQCLIEFGSQKTGLTQLQVRERIAESKKYVIKPEKKQSIISKFFNQIKELMVLVLLLSGVVSIIIGIVEKSVSEIVDGTIILGIVFLNAFFGVYQERKSEKAIESLKSMTQPQTQVFRDGKLLKINATDLVFGDIVFLNAGSIVPADLRLVESIDLKTNESALTGESVAVEKNADLVFKQEVSLAERKNCVFCGSFVESGVAKGVVVDLGVNTEIGKIATSLRETKKENTPLQKNIQFVGKVLTYLILLIATITFILEVIAGPQQILRAFLTAVAISVAAIPESLPAVITIIMSLGIGKLSKQKAIVKRMHAVETLGCCDVICSDKTGTITQNKMKVEKWFGFFEKTSSEFDFFLKNITLCNDSKLGENGFVGSATEIALMNFAQSCGKDKQAEEQRHARITEEPFSSKSKMMFVLNKMGKESVCFAKGALDCIIKMCTFCQTEKGIVCLDEKMKKEIFSANKTMCEDALRVIAFAYKTTDKLERSGFIFQGLCGMFDPPRREVFDAVEKCKGAGMRPIMITGDFKDTAFAIAKKVGIAKNESEVLSGEEIDAMSEEEFVNNIERKNVFARVSPEHKVKIVSALKKLGHIVAMTGDGINDAPSLKTADIGIGMGMSGTDVIKETADILITDDNFATIIVAVKEGRKIYGNIQKTIKYLFSANMAEILALFFITILLPGKTFLLPIQILFVNLITDSLPAIALGTEAAEKGVMREKPRGARETLLSGGAGVSILVLGSIQTLLTLAAYLFGFFVYGEPVAITMAFYTLNLIQLFYMFTARTKQSCFKSNPFKNKFFTLSLIAGFVILIVIACTPISHVLNLTSLNVSCWVLVAMLSTSIVFIGEIYKAVERKIFNKKLH